MKGVGQVVSFSGAINGFQYNGGQQTPFPTTANGCLITTIEYTFTGISVSYGPVIGTPPTLPGSYTVNAKLIGTGCGGVSSGDFSFIISPKDITGSFTGVNKQYDGNNSATISTPLPGAIVGGETVSLSGGVATFNDASVANGKTVTLTGATITGANAGNYNLLGVSTTTANITKKDITVTVNANQSKVYGSADPTSFFYTLSTPLVNGEVLTGALTRSLGEIVGPYIISQGTLANSNYNITYVGNNFNITKATLTITAEDKLKLYGATVPALTYTYTGLVSGDVLPLTTISTTALASSPVDSYPITVSAASDANYTINYVAGTLTVNKVPLIITAENKSKVYGAIDPIFTYTYSGLVNGDLATFTWPTIITAALPNSPVGTYPIIPSAATDPNYTISYVNGTLTVTKAPLTITAKPHTITYNGTAYTGGNGVVPTGFAAGESISSLTGTLNYTGTSQGAKNVDTYTIIPGGLSSPNYNINYVGGALEIKKATLKVIAGDQSVNFGTPAAKILTDATFTYASLLGSDDASAITGSLSYSTNYTPLTSTGTSGIFIEPIITGLSAVNYELIAEKGNITITAPPASPVFQIPNAFTPNSDGHNDTFKIVQNGYVTSIISFRVFTKSGKLIFSDKDGAWDGRYGGVMLDADVYIWIADFINKNNVTEHLSGTVLLLK